METKAMDVDGIPMRWLEEGEGTPVVLVHGIPTSPELWRRVMPRLRGVRALAWEMVGYGASIPAGRDLDISLARQADYLAAWMRALGLERAVLVGHDLGGGVVQIAAVRHPSLVAGLVLTNCVGGDFWPIPSVKAIQRLGGLVARAPRSVQERLFHLLIRRKHDQDDVARDSADLHWRNYAGTEGASALVRQARSLDTRDTEAIRPALEALRALPSRVVWGAADRSLKVRHGRGLARDLGAPFEPLPGARHFVPEDHPDAVARAIDEVVKESAARAG